MRQTDRPQEAQLPQRNSASAAHTYTYAYIIGEGKVNILVLNAHNKPQLMHDSRNLARDAATGSSLTSSVIECNSDIKVKR